MGYVRVLGDSGEGCRLWRAGREYGHLSPLQVTRRKKKSIIFVDFAAKGTLARHIIDGAERVRIYGEEIPVRAQIYTINGFSAHADQDELLTWHHSLGNPSLTFLVHGEEEGMRKFAQLLPDARVEMPMLGQSYPL